MNVHIWRKIVVICCMLLIFLKVEAQQTGNYQSFKIISPSPTAASFGAHRDLSVGCYFGTPNLSIPLNDIKIYNNSLFDHMQYNASGIRVNENANWIKLGWSLSASGGITRTVRGMDDFGTEGYN